VTEEIAADHLALTLLEGIPADIAVDEGVDGVIPEDGSGYGLEGGLDEGGLGMDWAFPRYLSSYTISEEGSYEKMCIIPKMLRVFVTIN
jgi:hypothetical protein